MNLPAVSKARFVRALHKLGFILEHQKGSHQKWRHRDGRFVYVYMHPREELRPSTLRSILRDAQISEDEFWMPCKSQVSEKDSRFLAIFPLDGCPLLSINKDPVIEPIDIGGVI